MNDLTNNPIDECGINFNSELVASINLIYDPCQFKYSKPIPERESAEYGAYIFQLNSANVRFRVAKITPTKIGQFVTL